MRIVVGEARCHTLEPDLFPLDDLGYVDVTDPEVQADQAERARRAVAACPERALSLAES